MSLKLGTQTASISNHIYSRATIGQPEPTVGMGATLLCWTDRHAATITKVETIGGKVHVTIQQDNAKRSDKNGMSESQEYEYTPNLNGHQTTFRQDENGGWQQVRFNATTKRWSKIEGEGLMIGKRAEYHDFSF